MAVVSVWRDKQPPRAAWPWLAAAAAGLTWPLAGPGAWAALTGGLPSPLFFFAISLLIWCAGWLALASALAPAREWLPRWAPAVCAVGGGAALVWGILRWLPGRFAWLPWLADLVTILAFAESAIILAAALGAVRTLVAGGSPREAGARALAVGVPRSWRLLAVPALCGAGGGVWMLLRLYLVAFVPDALLRPWAGWALATALVAAGLAALWAMLGTEPAPAAAAAHPSARATGVAAAVYVVAIVAFAALQPTMATGGASTATELGIRQVQSLYGHAHWAAAQAAARRASALAAGALALRWAAAGDIQDATAVATAAVAMDPAAPAARQAAGLLALARGDSRSALLDAQALMAAGQQGPGAYLASQACATVAADGRCRAYAAAEALWDAPQLVLSGPAVPSPRRGQAAQPTPSAPDADFSRAVALWAASIAAPVPQGTVSDAAVALARSDLLSSYLNHAPGLDAGAQADAGLAMIMAGAGVGDGGAINQGVALMHLQAPPSVQTAQLLYQAAAIYGLVAVDIRGGALPTPYPPNLSKAILAVAQAPSASPTTLYLAGEYALLTANRGTGTSVSGEKEAVGFFTRYLRTRPSDAAGWTDLALANYELGQFEQAIQAAEHATAVHPDAEAEIIDGQSRFGLAQAAKQQADQAADLQGAVTHLKRGLAANPTPFLAWMALGDVYVRQKQYQQALGAYQQALTYYQYDLDHHVDTFSAPHEGWAVTGMPGRGAGKNVIQQRINNVKAAMARGH